MIELNKVDALARAFCIAAGLDPEKSVHAWVSDTKTRIEQKDGADFDWPVPQWVLFRGMAFDRMAMDEALK